MQVSARILGQDYGMTAEEMNKALLKHGFLEGEPGAYSLTEEGLKYAIENDYHRGTGGYPWYNRYWTTRTYDDSIKNELNITDDMKKEIRLELSEARAARKVALAAERAAANAELQAKMVAEAVAEEAAKEAAAKEAAEEAEAAAIKRIENWKRAGTVMFIVAGVVLVGYGIYKAAPKVKVWWNKRKEVNQNVNENKEEI